MGIWDDHDYGCNNAGKNFKKKHELREIYLDFIDEPKDSDRRLERGTGIYQDYVVTSQDGVKVHFILLDVRFDYDEEHHDRFGPQQLAWLDEKLTEHSDSDVTLIGSGVQIIPDRWFFTEAFHWPSKKVLFEMVRKHRKSGVLLLSGDVHFA